MINLTALAPDIQAAILDETLPDRVWLFDLARDTPLSWEEQRGRVSNAANRPDLVSVAEPMASSSLLPTAVKIAWPVDAKADLIKCTENK